MGAGRPGLLTFMKFWWPLFLALKLDFFWPKVTFAFLYIFYIYLYRYTSLVNIPKKYQFVVVLSLVFHILAEMGNITPGSRIHASPRAWLAGSEQPCRLQDKKTNISFGRYQHYKLVTGSKSFEIVGFIIV